MLTSDPTEILLAIAFTRGLEAEVFLRARARPSCLHGPSQRGESAVSAAWHRDAAPAKPASDPEQSQPPCKPGKK